IAPRRHSGRRLAKSASVRPRAGNNCTGAECFQPNHEETSMPIGATFHDWSEATMTSLGAALALLFAAIPKILAFALILLIGWFVASLLQRAVAGLARAVHFNNLARRSGFADFVQRMGIDTDASGFLGQLAKWFIRLIALIVAF